MSAPTVRRSGAFPTSRARRRWWILYLFAATFALVLHLVPDGLG